MYKTTRFSNYLISQKLGAMSSTASVWSCCYYDRSDEAEDNELVLRSLTTDYEVDPYGPGISEKAVG